MQSATDKYCTRWLVYAVFMRQAQDSEKGSVGEQTVLCFYSDMQKIESAANLGQSRTTNLA